MSANARSMFPARGRVVLFRFLLVAAAAACRASPEADPSVAEAAARAAEEVRRAVAKDGRGGAAFGIFVGGAPAHTGGFGCADLECRFPVRADHLFRIGSITKPVTAMAMLRLVHEGRARFGDPVAVFVPELERVANPYSWTPGPSVFQLGTMTGGLAREPENLPEYLVGAPERWLETAVRALGATSFEYEPGTRY